MQVISSKENALIKHISKLKEKKYRNEYCEYLIEGVKLISEAIEESLNIKNIIVSEECLNSELYNKHLKNKLNLDDIVIVEKNLFKQITEVDNPQGILAIVKKNNKVESIDYKQDIILVLDGVQDPGNLGTIIRTADSVGVNQILVSKGTVDAYNSKVIRSTMGAIFRVEIIECEDLVKTLKDVKNNNFKIMVTSLEAKKSIYDLKLKNMAVVIGNEANGVSKQIQEIADEKAIIPMTGKTESLNASVATGIILYEHIRQTKFEK